MRGRGGGGVEAEVERGGGGLIAKFSTSIFREAACCAAPFLAVVRIKRDAVLN